MATAPAHTPPHLLGIEDLDRGQIERLLALCLSCAQRLEKHRTQKRQNRQPLAGRSVFMLFFENSTRTRTSFELAAKHCGAHVVNITPSHSSLRKGETLLDTAITLNAMGPDALVVRHPYAGAAKLLARKMSCPVINAGDGAHEHPTQALVDACAILRHRRRIEGLTIAICGDVRHSRVARSNIHLLTRMGAQVRVIAPPTLLPRAVTRLGVESFNDMRRGLAGCDIVMMLRLQKERIRDCCVPSRREYFHFFGLTRDKLALAAPDALVMHPGPMNRGIEIDGALADDLDRSIIHEQVTVGVAARMACLSYVFTKNGARDRPSPA